MWPGVGADGCVRTASWYMDAASDTMTRRMWRRSRCAATLLRLPVLFLAQIKELVSRIQGLLDQIVDLPVPNVTGEIPVFVGVWEEIVDAIQLVLQEQVFQSIRVQIVDGTERVVEQIVVPRSTPQERVQNLTQEQIMDFPVSQILEERVQNRTQDQIAVSPVPQIMEAVVEVLPSTPQERVQNRTQERVPNPIVEQIGGVPVPQIQEVVLDGMRHVPQERMQHRVVEQMGDGLVRQIQEVILDGMRHASQERVLTRTLEQFVDVPVPQIMKGIVENDSACASRARTSRGADRLYDRAQDHGGHRGNDSACASHVRERVVEQIRDEPVHQIMKGVVEMTQCASRARARTSRGSDRERASAPHHGRYRGWYASCTT